jgi:hypothetical protein
MHAHDADMIGVVGLHCEGTVIAIADASPFSMRLSAGPGVASRLACPLHFHAVWHLGRNPNTIA